MCVNTGQWMMIDVCKYWSVDDDRCVQMIVGDDGCVYRSRMVISDLLVPCGCQSRLCASGVQLYSQVQSQVGGAVSTWNGRICCCSVPQLDTVGSHSICS